MIHFVDSCKSCPLLEYQGGGSYKCSHPKSTVYEYIYNDRISEVHQDCPLKVVDLILTVRSK